MNKFKKTIASLTATELTAKLAELKQTEVRARMDQGARKLKNTRQIFNIRKQIAIILSKIKHA